jgi:hypothetical protein
MFTLPATANNNIRKQKIAVGVISREEIVI